MLEIIIMKMLISLLVLNPVDDVEPVLAFVSILLNPFDNRCDQVRPESCVPKPNEPVLKFARVPWTCFVPRRTLKIKC